MSSQQSFSCSPASSRICSLWQLIVCATMLTAWAEPGANPVKAESVRAGFRFGAEKPVVIAETVRVDHGLGPVVSYFVEDGAAAADATFTAGIDESGGACGFSKDGAGTLRVEGDVKLSGVVTVYDGTLDFSRAALGPSVRVNLLGDAKLIPPTSGNPVAEIYINDGKLPPGTWGPPGSVATGSAKDETRSLGGVAKVPDSGPSRREIWRGLKYGIFSHYVWNGYGMQPGMNNADGSRAKSIDEFAEVFDVENYVDQLVNAEAQYVVFTAWHSGTCPMFPSAAMAKWAPGRPSCPKLDLLGKLLDTCRAKGIRTFFYCHPYQPVANPHNDWINDLFAELVDRYGSRLDGLWIDENFQDCTQDKVVDYPRLMRTIKERNPDLVLTHNNGGFQTYGVDAGVQEVQWEFHEGRMASQYQIFNQTAKSPEDMLITTVIQAAANSMGGGIQWSIDAQGPGKDTRGGLDATSRKILDPFVQLLKPIADSVKNTQPSSSYPPRFSGPVVKLASLRWGVATRSLDDTREYIHVLKAPEGKTLTLPPPADGKVFANARLLDGERAISMVQDSRSVSFTLPDDVSWKKPDTVIVMDVAAPGGVGLVNNTSRAVNYLGNSWAYQRNEKGGEFRADSHRATSDGDSFTFTFSGTDVALISSRGPDRGVVSLAIDGVPQGTVDLSKGSGNFMTVFSKNGLPRGTHTLTGTKRGGAVITVDAFRVSDLINDADAEIEFSKTTRHEPRAAALEGPWEPRGGSWINGHRFTFTFHGTSVEVLGGAAHGSGDLVLTIDGKEHSTVHCHGEQKTRTLALIDGLPNENHTVVGHYTNRHPAGFIPALDGFVVTRPDYWDSATARGLGEVGNDAHFSTIKGAAGKLTFQGSGVEVFVTRDAASRTAHYSLEGGKSSLWVGLNHYSPVTLPASPVFRTLNLVPGNYTVGFNNAANSQGINFSNVRLTVDAIRVHKGESSSAMPLFWGANGRGESGVWDSGTSANWHDGTAPAIWHDLGAEDYVAVFAGKGGTIEVPRAIRANCIVFNATGYTLRGESLQLTGGKPTLHIANGAKATISLTIRQPDGTPLPAGNYTAATHPQLITGGGVLAIESPR